MSNNQSKCVYKIHGTHCASCEILIERKFKKIPGVEGVKVNYANGKAEVYFSSQPKLQDLQNAIKSDGYSVSMWSEKQKAKIVEHKNTSKDYLQMGGIAYIASKIIKFKKAYV